MGYMFVGRQLPCGGCSEKHPQVPVVPDATNCEVGVELTEGDTASTKEMVR